MTGPIRRLLDVARPELPRLTAAAGLGAAASLSALGLTATSAWLISRAAQHPPMAALMVAIVAVRGFGVGRAALRYAERLSAHDAALRVLAGIRVRCYDAARRLSPGAPRFRNADLAARFVADVEAVPDVLIRGLLPLVAAALTGIGLLALIVSLDAVAAAVMLAALVISALVVPLLREWCAGRATAEVTELRARLMTATVDLADGLEDYLVNGAAEARRAELAELDRLLGRVQRRAARGAAISEALGPIVAGTAVAAMCAAGVQRVHAGSLGPVWLAVLVLTPLTAFEVFGQVPEAVARLRGARPGLRRLFEVLDAPPVVREPAAPRRLPAGPHTLRLAWVSAGWPGAGDCLHQVDLELTPGRRVAVVGDSGAGKSTLAAVLLRFLDPTAGCYLINGVDATTCAADDVRSVVVAAGQDSYLFDNTVRANMLMARPDAGEDEVWAALAEVGLADWLREQPRGMDTPVGPGGARLSGGQARRLVIARALLARPEVLVLDEPTEHLDRGTADALLDDLHRLTGGRTTLLITHELRGLEAFDEIVVLRDGSVVERGTHAELIAAAGAYLELWRARDAVVPVMR